MKNVILSDLHPFSKLLFTLFVILASFLLFVIIGSLLAIPLFGINIFVNPEALDISLHPEYIHASKYFQVIQSVSIFILPPFVVAYLFSQKPASYLRIRFQPPWLLFFISGIIMFTSLPLIGWMLELNEMLVLPKSIAGIESWMKEAEENRKEITDAYMAVESISGFLVNLIMIGFIAAIGEELLFRGLIQRLLSEWFRNSHWAVFTTALLFSALHMQFYGFIPRFALGLFLGYLFIWSGSLWVPILAHFVNNASAVTVYFLANKGYLKIDPEDFGNVESKLMFFTSVCIVFSLIIVFYLKRIRNVNEDEHPEDIDTLVR